MLMKESRDPCPAESVSVLIIQASNTIQLLIACIHPPRLFCRLCVDLTNQPLRMVKQTTLNITIMYLLELSFC
jgi:hypothetical protein